MGDERRGSSMGVFYGLRNQGSTCYLNSVLQVLFWTKQFRNAVRHSKDFNSIDVQLADLFQKLKQQTGTTVDVTQKLGIKRVNQQQDSAEHFEKILSLSSPEASQVFRGMLEHKTVCHGCRRETGAEGNFWHLPLPLVNSHSEDFSVIEGMEEFFRSSEFSGDNQVYCENCDSKQDATVACEMKRFPAVLTLLLKRFEFSYKSMNFTKNNRAVDVPYFLDIPQLQGELYELFAFIDHSGTLKSGHYTATIKCRQDNNQSWMTFNDSSVYQRTFNKHQVENDIDILNSQSAYLLFYRRTHAGMENIKHNAENEKETQRYKKVKMQGEGGVRKGEEHVNMDDRDRKRKAASNKSQVEDSAVAIAERNDVARKEKDGKTNRMMRRSEEGERPETEADDRNREITRQERENREERPNRSVKDRVITERENVVEVQRKEKEEKERRTSREVLKGQEDKRLETEADDRNREITRQERDIQKRNPSVKVAQVDEIPPEKPKRRRSSDPTQASPEPKRKESRDHDEGEPRRSGSDRQTERKTDKTERKERQDQEDELEPLQEDIGSPSGSKAKNKTKKKWFSWLRSKKQKNDREENTFKKQKKDKTKKRKCIFRCLSGADDES